MVDATEPGEARIRARQLALLRRVAWPVIAMSRGTLVAAIIAAAVGLVLGIVTRTWVGGLVAGAAAGGGALVVAWSPILRPDVRGAFELVNDHDCHELDQWRRETGSAFPRSVPAMRSWLAEHPSGPGRASTLVRMGRLDGARAVLDESPIDEPHDAFAVEILRETAAVYAGRQPDLTRLHGAWQQLPDDREKRHQRECLAMLEALASADGGGDPTAVLGRARLEIQDVHPSMRASRILARWALIPMGAVIAGAAAASIVVGR